MSAETPEDWEELTRFGGATFPDGWSRKMTDAAYWRPTVEWMFAKHGLPLEGELVPGVEARTPFS